MLDLSTAQILSRISEIKSFLPWISFLAGVGGSLHCIGMCGGLVTASCDSSKDIFRYQAGRLIGYLFLGVIASLVGGFFDLRQVHPFVALLPPLFLGSLFIFWGFQSYRGKKAEIPTPRFLGSLYYKLWQKLVRTNQGLSKAFYTGAISILLPCGLLYGVILGTLALQHGHEMIFSMFFFWLGTVPSMVIAPNLIRRFIHPLKAKLPKVYALSLMTIGVVTIGLRVANAYHPQYSVHQKPKEIRACH